MKILHVCAVGFTVKNLLLPQIQYFISQGLEVEIACSPSHEVAELQQKGCRIHPINIDRKISPASNFKSIIDLTQVMRKQKYDLVHVHTPIASVLGRVAAKFAGIPRVVYTAHGFYFHDNMTPAKYRFFHTIEKVAGTLTDLILTQSEEDLKTAEKTKLCPANKLRYLGNGVDLSRFQRSHLKPEQQQQLKQDLKISDAANPIIGMTGRITEEKGYLELIEAIALLSSQFPQIHLVVIGGQLSSERDAFQTQLQNLIDIKHLDTKVTFTGFRSDIPELLGLLDLFVLPSYREGLPRSILEAMAMELPVVTTDIRGCREAVENNQTGLIVSPKNPQQLAAAIRKICQDQNLQTKLGQSGLKRVREKFDEQLVFERLHSAYQELGVLA